MARLGVDLGGDREADADHDREQQDRGDYVVAALVRQAGLHDWSGEGGGSSPLTVQGLPLVKPPYSRITAIDLDKGEFRWQVPFGATPDAR